MAKSKKLPRKLTLDDCEITLRIEPEDLEVRGNAMATDEPEADRKAEDEIIERLDGGDLWAWCHVVVRVTPKELVANPGTLGDLYGEDGLGACSYRDEAEFRQPSGYFDDMCSNALAALQTKVDAYRKYL